MFRPIIGIICAFSVSTAFAQFPRQAPTMGGGSVSNSSQAQGEVNPSNSTCAQLRSERDALNQITEKMQWVPIDQQNANYHRMNQIKRDMATLRCAQ